jgi:uncharacterized membrane protein
MPGSTGAESAPAGTGAVPPRSRIALAAACLVGVSVLSLLGIVLFSLLAPPAATVGILPRVLVGLLYAGLIVGAVAGHVLGLIAFTRQSLRDGRESGRSLAFASAVLGVLILLACSLMNVMAVTAFKVVTGAR